MWGELHGFFFCPKDSEDSNTNKPILCSVLPFPSSCLSAQMYLYSHHLLLNVIVNSLNLPFQHAQSKDIFPSLCIISGVHFLWFVLFSLMVNGYISWLCKIIQWLCTVSIKGMCLSCSAGGGSYKLSLTEQKDFTSRKKKACFALKEKYKWNEIHLKTLISVLCFRKQLHCADLVTLGKGIFVKFEWRAKRGKRSFGLLDFLCLEVR